MKVEEKRQIEKERLEASKLETVGETVHQQEEKVGKAVSEDSSEFDDAELRRKILAEDMEGMAEEEK